jgi:AraC-like DNA-binding protein
LDALSELLRTVRLTGAVFLDVEFRDPWCIRSRGVFARRLMPDAERFIDYHFVVEGTCLARIDEAEAVRLEAGNVLVIPSGEPHVMGSALHLAPVPLSEILEPPRPGVVQSARHGGEGPVTRVVCGFLACDPRLCRPILSALPRLMRVDLRSSPSGPWLETSIRQSVSEAASTRAGADVILARLSEALFVEALRRFVETMPQETRNWLAGLRDPFVGRGLKLMHARPAHAWTVDELAREVGCSRSVLAERFTDYLGQPPIHYLSAWRLALSADRLRSGTASVARIAEEVGYESEAAFSRAFRREFGLAPTAWRRLKPGPPPQREG